MNNFLIISFYFPPFKRVGGRRWAKHTKFLWKLGLQPCVLAADFNGETSPWDKDIELYKENIYRIPIKIKYPYHKRVLPNNLFEKFYWKISLICWIFKIKKHKGNFLDDSLGYEALFMQKAVEIIQEKDIEHIIISVGPFHYAKIIPELKKRFPLVKITIDYRDYWEDGFSSLSEKQKRHEKLMQETILRNVNNVLTVNNEMTSYFKTHYNLKSVYTLPHCFDPEDMAKYSVSRKIFPSAKSTKLNFLYGGALYLNITNYLFLFFKLIKALQENNFFSITDIYTAQSGYKELFEKSAIEFNIHPYASTEEYFSKMKDADYLLFFRPDWSPNAISSKFFELVAFRKPIIYFGPEGDISKFINNNKLGFCFNNENFESSLNGLIDDMSIGSVPDQNYDLTVHTFEHQSKLLLNYLNVKV